MASSLGPLSLVSSCRIKPLPPPPPLRGEGEQKGCYRPMPSFSLARPPRLQRRPEQKGCYRPVPFFSPSPARGGGGGRGLVRQLLRSGVGSCVAPAAGVR